jgi:hypothetical protein
MYIYKLKNPSTLAFQASSQKIPENHNNLKPYFLSLFLIGLAMLCFYYFYLKYYGGIYFAHYSEYYSRAVAIADSLMNLDFSSAVRYYLESYVDKILLFRSIPFLFFGPSHFVFFYSNVFFNLSLLMILFHSLLKIMPPQKAFYFTLLILSQYFFIELLASFYVDLSFFLICSIFFIYLSLFDKNPKQYNIRLILIVFLVFLIKNVSYPLVIIVSVLYIIYFLAIKKNRWCYVLRFSIIVMAGFLIYFLAALGGSVENLVDDLNATISIVSLDPTKPLISALFKIFGSFRLYNNINLLNKFPCFWLNLIIYPVVIFMAYKKREVFWVFLFFVSEFFFFFFYNLKGHSHDFRFFLPFYFVYLYFAYEILISLLNKIVTARHTNKILFLLILILFFISFTKLMNPKKETVYSVPCVCVDYFSSHLPTRAKIYIANMPDYYDFYSSCFLDGKKDYSYLATIDPRFKYKIVDCVENADYIIGKASLRLEHPEYKLITSTGKRCLFKIK